MPGISHQPAGRGNFGLSLPPSAPTHPDLLPQGWGFPMKHKAQSNQNFNSKATGLGGWAQMEQERPPEGRFVSQMLAPVSNRAAVAQTAAVCPRSTATVQAALYPTENRAPRFCRCALRWACLSLWIGFYPDHGKLSHSEANLSSSVLVPVSLLEVSLSIRQGEFHFRTKHTLDNSILIIHISLN